MECFPVYSLQPIVTTSVQNSRSVYTKQGPISFVSSAFFFIQRQKARGLAMELSSLAEGEVPGEGMICTVMEVDDGMPYRLLWQ
jgi:hypothetical protein